MTYGTKSKRDVLYKLQDHYVVARSVLGKKFVVDNIIVIVKERRSGVTCSRTLFSFYNGIRKTDKNFQSIAEDTFQEVIDVLDEIILFKHNKTWDAKSENYIDKSKDNAEDAYDASNNQEIADYYARIDDRSGGKKASILSINNLQESNTGNLEEDAVLNDYPDIEGLLSSNIKSEPISNAIANEQSNDSVESKAGFKRFKYKGKQLKRYAIISLGICFIIALILTVPHQKLIKSLFSAFWPTIGLENITFNNTVEDYPTIAATVYDSNVGPSLTATWTKFCQAKVGDIINFRIYYHNTTQITAKNTKISLTIKYSGNNIIGTASISCDNSKNVIAGAATVYVTNSDMASTIFQDMLWYPDHNSYTTVQLPDGQKDTQLLEPEGICIGDIYPDINRDYEHQGSIVAAFKVMYPKN